MTFPLKIVGFLKQKGADVILITMDMSTPSTAGINLTFGSGSLNIDWKEGGGLVPFVSGVELTHTYITPGTYIAEITGDLENITQFIADNSKITFIEDLVTGLLTDFRINDNLYSGVLDMSLAPISGIFRVQINAGLTRIIHATSGNAVTVLYFAYSCGLIGNHDLSNNPIGGTFWINSNTGMTGIDFASSGNNLVSDMKVNVCGLVGTIDFSNVPLSGSSSFNSNPLLTGIIYSLTGNGAVTFYIAYACTLPNQDFSNFATSDNIQILLQNNVMTSTEVDNQIIHIDSLGWINGVLTLTGTNAARTSASDAANTNLLANGWAVNTN